MMYGHGNGMSGWAYAAASTLTSTYPQQTGRDAYAAASTLLYRRRDLRAG